MYSGLFDYSESGSWEDDVVRLQTEGKQIPARFLAREIDRLRAEVAQLNARLSTAGVELVPTPPV